MFNQDKTHSNDPKKASVSTEPKKDTLKVTEPKKDEHKDEHKKVEATKK